MERKQFTFYSSFFDAISRIRNKEDKADAYDAICAYALTGAEPDLDALSDAASIAFLLIKPNLDASRRKADSGSNGGKQQANDKQTISKQQANDKQTASKQQANDKQTAREKEKEGEKEKEKERENESYIPPVVPPSGLTPTKRFTPPTLAEVQSYVAERHSPVDPQSFIDFYATKGWMVGKTPMKDWKAACRNAEKWDRWAKAPQGRNVIASGAPPESSAVTESAAWMRAYLEGGGGDG